MNTVQRPKDAAPVAIRVRQLRLQHGLTQQELAEKAGVSRHALLRFESGASFRPTTLRKIARALGVQPIQLTVG